MRACTLGGWAQRLRVSTTFLTQKNSQICLTSARDAGGVRTSNLLDLESDTLPTEPPRLPNCKYIYLQYIHTNSRLSVSQRLFHQIQTLVRHSVRDGKLLVCGISA